MRLVDLVRQETGANDSEIVLLRHFNSIDRLVELGGSLDEFTALQPTGTKWDFWADGKPRIQIVVVIVHNVVSAVYRVFGVEAEGTFDALATHALRQFDIDCNLYKKDQPTRRFKMIPVPCTATNATITGWEGKERNPIIRSNAGFFQKIKVDLPDGVRLTEEAVTSGKLFEGAVCRVTVNAYERNLMARSQCIAHHGPTCVVCGFSFGAVYGSLAEGFVHVHHVKALSEIDREYEVDPVADLKPVCANCHAIIHLGGNCRSVQETRGLVDPRVLAFWASFAK
jgi:hypothetical protein